jgi:hypothetical protein
LTCEHRSREQFRPQLIHSLECLMLPTLFPMAPLKRPKSRTQAHSMRETAHNSRALLERVQRARLACGYPLKIRASEPKLRPVIPCAQFRVRMRGTRPSKALKARMMSWKLRMPLRVKEKAGAMRFRPATRFGGLLRSKRPQRHLVMRSSSTDLGLGLGFRV